MRHELAGVICVAVLLVAAPAVAQISPGPLAKPHASLEGALNCVKCHGGGKESMSSRCLDCHREIRWLIDQNRGFHARTPKANCASCHPDHVGVDFALIKWPDGSSSTFNHARAGWPLTGKHTTVTCAKCHTTQYQVSPSATLGPQRTTPGWVGLETNCVSCHEDVHKGTMKGTCEHCHVTSSFSSMNGKSFSHDETRYPLRGKHASVACKSCHVGYPTHIDKPAFGKCTSCHLDYHRGQATIAGVAVDCASCHTVSGFTPATFTVAQHARTRYPLVGKHATVSCASCHDRRDARGVREVVMRPAFARCESCHGDAAHGTQLVSRGAGAACTSCHTVGGWKPSTFTVAQHASSKFPLTGRHASADCGSCHAADRRFLPPLPPARTLGTARVALHLTETTCEGCHRDPHGGRYHATVASAQGTCVSCHDTRAFHPSTIDVAAHSRFAFALDGAHRAAPCVACHTTMQRASVGSSLKLAPAPAKAITYTVAGAGASCATCHTSPHGTQFASRSDAGACQSCHDLQAWAPASRFKHDANGGFDLGAAHERLACSRCHVPTGANGVRKWRGVPRNCEACHTSGVKSE